MLIDWESQALSTSLPIGGACNGLLFLCRIYSSLSKPKIDDDDIFSKSTRSPKGLPSRRPLLTGAFSLISLVLVTVGVVNTILCAKRRRKYTLLGRSASKDPGTPSAQKVNYKEPDLSDDSSPSSENLWQLNMWDPPRFNMYFCAVYSPLHIVYILYSPLSIFLPFFLAITSAFLVAIVYMYETLIKDKSILHSEVLGEYEKKIVRPVIASVRRDVSIGSDGSVETYAPSTNSQFIQRDVRESKSRVTLTPTKDRPWQPSSSRTLRHRASVNSLNLSSAPRLRYSTPLDPSSPLSRKSARGHSNSQLM